MAAPAPAQETENGRVRMVDGEYRICVGGVWRSPDDAMRLASALVDFVEWTQRNGRER